MTHLKYILFINSSLKVIITKNFQTCHVFCNITLRNYFKATLLFTQNTQTKKKENFTQQTHNYRHKRNKKK